MVNISELSYKVILQSETGKEYDLTAACDRDAQWTEDDETLSTRIDVKAANISIGGRFISDIAKLGTRLSIRVGAAGSEEEIARGSVNDWQPTISTDGQFIQLTAFDVLHAMMKSEDNVFVTAGTDSNVFIKSLAQKWGITIGRISLPSVSLPKTVYRGSGIVEMISETLKEVKRQTGVKGIIRSNLGAMDILKRDENQTVYRLDNDVSNTIRDRMDISDMITRVVVIGKEDSSGKSPLEATVNGLTEFGIRQKIVIRQSDDTLDKAKKDAQEILDEDGKPSRTIGVVVPDVPWIRKGDRVFIEGGTASDYFSVTSITHDLGERRMTIEAEAIDT